MNAFIEYLIFSQARLLESFYLYQLKKTTIKYMLTTTTSVLFRKPCVYVKVTHPSHVSKENHRAWVDLRYAVI